MTCFCVMGSHGGGTSLVAGMLDALGVGMHYNPKARIRVRHKYYLNYEDTEFVVLNARILAAAGGKWDKPPQLVKVLSAQADFEARIKDLIVKRSDSELWGFKDPRTALTVRLYHSWLPNPQYIYVKREVEDVVQSIMSRGPSGKDEEYWAQLAVTYYRRIEAFLEFLEAVDVPVLRLDFEKLRTERGEALRLAEFVGCADEVDKAIEVIIV